MPITREELLGITAERVEDWRQHILSFLRDHYDQAFNQEELLREMGASSPAEAFQEALYRLVDSNAVEEGLVDGEWYYAAKSSQ